jgi:PAS domain S-box-containing protein
MKMDEKSNVVYPGMMVIENDVISTLTDHAAATMVNARATTRLQHPEATYATLFEDSADLILITNYDGFILDINRTGCQMLQRPKGVLIGSNLTFMLPPLKAFLAQQTRQLKDWAEASIEIEVSQGYRQTLPLEIKVRQIQYKGQDAVEWVGRDISARKAVERVRQDMLTMLVHDLRGPLGNLINVIDYISMVFERGQTLEQSKIIKLLEMSKRSGQTLQDLVDSILDVSRLKQGEVPLQRAMTNLSQLLQAVQDQVLLQVLAKDMVLTVQPVPETAEVWLDSNFIRRVLINLVSNAIKFTPSQGHITLTTWLTTGMLHFAVSDDGPGISQGDQAHIFDKFSRIDNSANAPAGVGLGLTFCKLAIEAHQGAIAVESEGIPGKGCTFHVTIPLIEPA